MNLDQPDKADYSGVPVVTLESIRIRLSQLVHSLAALNTRVQAMEPPAWPALHQQFNVVLLQLNSLAMAVSSAQGPLKEAVTYPLPTFPVRTKSWLLTTLLRKKNLPEVDEWIADGQESGKDIDTTHDDEFCDWALELAQEVFGEGIERSSIAPEPRPTSTKIEKVVGYMSGKD